MQGKALVIDKTPVYGRHGEMIGHQFLASIHQPRTPTLEYLAQPRRASFYVNAVHIAFDFLLANQEEALSAGDYLCTRLRQTWRRPQDCVPMRNSFYWKRNRQEARNIIVYSDRSSKIGEAHCCHLELRFTGADACKRAGLSNPLNLSRGIDALALLKRQTKIAVVDPARFERVVERMARQYFRKTKSRQPTVWRNGTMVELTLDLLSAKMLQLLARSLGVAPLDESDLPSIRSQDIWDSRHRALRSALVEVPWEEVTPCPVWHPWR